MVDLPPATKALPDDVPPRPMEFESQTEQLKFERSRYPRATESDLDFLACNGTRPIAGGRLSWKHDPLFARRWPFRSEDHWPRLEALKQPLLVVKAADSPVLQEEVAQQMVSRSQHGRLELVAKSGHVVHVENPGGLASAVVPFAEGSQPRRSLG
jgi:pimeloyl-ACP methyl ester carboxylesterase